MVISLVGDGMRTFKTKSRTNQEFRTLDSVVDFDFDFDFDYPAISGRFLIGMVTELRDRSIIGSLMFGCLSAHSAYF